MMAKCSPPQVMNGQVRSRSQAQASRQAGLLFWATAFLISNTPTIVMDRPSPTYPLAAAAATAPTGRIWHFLCLLSPSVIFQPYVKPDGVSQRWPSE
jgi:hypothetical protein